MKKRTQQPPQISTWKGSPHTAALIRAQIAERWGKEEAQKYDPEKNCFTFNTWKAKGYHVKKGEHGMLSTTIVKLTDKDENETGSYPQKVWLFYYLQVEPIKAKS